MKRAGDTLLVQRLATAQRGVFSKADLQTALAEAHPAAFVRRVKSLEALGIVRRFARGWYVVDPFDLGTLSQRIAPGSYISFDTVLARRGVIGTNPERRVTAVKMTKARSYDGLGFRVDHVRITPNLFFGFDTDEDGVRYANAEKAVLDALYFHLRGRRYVFDIYSDLDRTKLDLERLESYLAHYANPKFIPFAKGVLELS